MQALRVGILLSLLASQVEALAAPLAAKKDGVPVTSAPKKDASVLHQLKQGETIEAAGREGMYWKVQLPDGRSGFIPVLLVQRQTVGHDGLQAALKEAALEARDEGSSTSTRARSAVMGIRGLDESGDLGLIGSMRPDLRAVYRMEDRTVAPERIEAIEQLVATEVERVSEQRQRTKP